MTDFTNAHNGIIPYEFYNAAISVTRRNFLSAPKRCCGENFDMKIYPFTFLSYFGHFNFFLFSVSICLTPFSVFGKFSGIVPPSSLIVYLTFLPTS
jgi:hypothetical protein